MQILLILSLLITVWLDRETAPKRNASGSKRHVKSTSLSRQSGADAHHFG